MILLERIKMRNVYRSPDRAKNIYKEIKNHKHKHTQNQKSLLRLNDASHKQSNIGFLYMYTCICTCSYNGSVRETTQWLELFNHSARVLGKLLKHLNLTWDDGGRVIPQSLISSYQHIVWK